MAAPRLLCTQKRVVVDALLDQPQLLRTAAAAGAAGRALLRDEHASLMWLDLLEALTRATDGLKSCGPFRRSNRVG